MNTVLKKIIVMKNTTKLIIALVLSALSFAATAQVKQAFKVVDFNTKRPIAGATSSLYGQTLTTDAKGVAVANLSADQKGAYLPLEKWGMDGYALIGRAPVSYYKDFQTSDTIFFQMVPRQDIRKEQQELTVQFFRWWNDHYVMEYVNNVLKDIRDNPDEASSLAYSMTEDAANTRLMFISRYRDADDINKYQLCEYYDNPAYADVLRVLRTGDVDSAVAMVKSHIDTTDNSRASLEWIDLFRTLKQLNMGTRDKSLVSDYTVYLYRNKFYPDEAAHYIQDLNNDNRYEMANEIIRLEKANNRDPRLNSTFESPWFQYYKKDNAKMKANAEASLNSNKSTYYKYPYYKTLGDMYWMYKNLYIVYQLTEDSLSAIRAYDSTLAYLGKYISCFSGNDVFAKNQQLIDHYHYVIDATSTDYVDKEKIQSLYDAIYDAAKANYDSDTANLFLRLQLADNALLWLKDSPEPVDNMERKQEIFTQLNDVLIQLTTDFPEFFSLQNVQISAQLLAACIVSNCDSKKMDDAFQRYVKSYETVNNVFPNLFEGGFLRMNNMFESYLASDQQTVIANELSDFNERLLKISAGNDPQKLLVLKAEQANKIAETLFSDEDYENAVGYYLQSIEYYEKAIPNDTKLWIPYLRNYLQMGDAHLYQNQFDKALMTYRKILDFEPQIPASMIPEYTTMKGSVYYYNSDAYKAMDDMKRAEKEFKMAEKLYKKGIALGDTSAYPLLGEMYLGKASAAVQAQDYKKCMQMLEKSIGFYESCGMDRPLTRYERGKSTLGLLYQMFGKNEEYYKNAEGLVKFYRKFANTNRDYASGLVEYAEKLLNSERITKEDALLYSKDIIKGLEILNQRGEDVELPYLRGLFNLAKVYATNDSIQQAIDLFRGCIPASEYMFADTAMDTHQGNLVEIYKKLALCYESMAEEIDTAHSELWYYRAVDVRDTLIDLMTELSEDGDVNQLYELALEYRKNGLIFYELEMIPSAQDYFDKSNEKLLMLYNSEYKADVEDDVIHNYFLKGLVYKESGNEEKAIANYRKAVEFGERMESDEFSRFYLVTLADLIQILEKDKDANAAEIAKLEKQLKEQSKKLK